MRTYLLKRLLLLPVTLLGVTMIVFGMIQLAPGDPAAMVVRGEDPSSVEAIEKWRTERHLDEPVVVQYLYWIRDVALLDFGESFRPPNEPVLSRLAEALPITIILNIISFTLVYLIAIPIGIICGVKQHSWWDRVLTALVFMLYALPVFWAGTMLIIFFANPRYLHWFPTTGNAGISWGDEGVTFWSFVKGWSWHVFLPLICLTYTGFAYLSRQMRSSVLEQIRQDYVRTARAKGLSGRTVVMRHVVRNSMIPIVTIFASIFPAMIAGSLIIEVIFSIPGMGRLFFEAVLDRDYPLIMGEVTIASVLTLAGVLISDICYVLVDPRISYE